MGTSLAPSPMDSVMGPGVRDFFTSATTLA
jgi:hypothetical protein